MSDMDNLNWVTARAACSVVDVFKQLELEVKNDVDEANRTIGSRERTFSVNTAPGRFSVTRSSCVALPVSVDFAMEANGIIIFENSRSLHVDVTLNNEGRCLFRVKTEELESWQLRRMALEDLFFGKGGQPMPCAPTP